MTNDRVGWVIQRMSKSWLESPSKNMCS